MENDVERREAPNFYRVPTHHVLRYLLGVFIIFAACIFPMLALYTVIKLQQQMGFYQDRVDESIRNSESHLSHRRRRHDNYVQNTVGQNLLLELQEIQHKLSLLERKVLDMDRLIHLKNSSSGGNALLKKPNEVKGILLQLAAAEGNLVRIRWLAKFKTDVSFRDESGNQALHQAARFSHPEILEELLEMGADINSSGDGNFTALHWVALLGCDECVQELLRKGASVECLDNWRETPLHKAASEGHVKILKELLAKSGSINRENFDGFTPLHLAAEHGHCDCVSALLNAGANVNLVNSYGYTPLHLAVKNGHVDCVSALLKFTADVNLKTNGGNTVLHLANAYQHHKLVVLLVKHSAKSNIKNRSGKIPSQCKSSKDL